MPSTEWWSIVDWCKTASFFILKKRRTQTVIITALLAPLISLCCCHHVKFNSLSVCAAARAWMHVPDTTASASGGNNGQVYTIRIQPNWWQNCVIWKPVYCFQLVSLSRRTKRELHCGSSQKAQELQNTGTFTVRLATMDHPTRQKAEGSKTRENGFAELVTGGNPFSNTVDGPFVKSLRMSAGDGKERELLAQLLLCH